MPFSSFSSFMFDGRWLDGSNSSSIILLSAFSYAFLTCLGKVNRSTRINIPRINMHITQNAPRPPADDVLPATAATLPVNILFNYYSSLKAVYCQLSDYNCDAKFSFSTILIILSIRFMLPDFNPLFSI